MQRVRDILEVVLQIDNHTPSHVVITAVGQVTSTGWSSPSLDPWFYVDTPQDGYQDFDFTAEPPATMANMVLSTITATLHVPVDIQNYWGHEQPLRGIRIHSQRSIQEFGLHDAQPLETNKRFPWDVFKPGQTLGSVNSPVSSLVGRPLRVYHTGDMVTQDYNPQRVNIELKPDSDEIVQITFG
ncbi:I78 family peptidase inhibitor [Rhizobium sp. SG2393]|uniref:I78 family peptidase inhibitor n=1 Tax=Rhizobium sp. SG2393 TaxID=3276279 RepID=UPI00366BB0C1